MGSNPFGFPCVGLLVVELEHVEHKHKRQALGIKKKNIVQFICHLGYDATAQGKELFITEEYSTRCHIESHGMCVVRKKYDC